MINGLSHSVKSVSAKTPRNQDTGHAPTFLRQKWLWVILALSLVIRLIYLLELRLTPFFDQLLLDLASYDRWALKISGGDWLGTRAFYQDPLYPYFLGILYWLFGHRLLIVYVLQMFLGTLNCYLVFWIGRRLFSAKAGLIAAAFAALYKPFIFYEIQIEKSFLAVLLVVGCCALLLRAKDEGSVRLWLFSGLCLGLVVLVRGNYLVLLPLLVAGFALIDHARFPIRAAGIFLLGVFSILGITFARNWFVGKDLVLTTSQGGQNFFIGNNAGNLTGMYRVPEFVRPDPRFEEIDFAREAERVEGRPMKPSEVSNFWFRRGLDFMRGQPLDFLFLLGRKALLFWNQYEIPDNLDQHYFERFSLIMRMWLPGFGVVAPLGLLGMVLCLRNWRRSWIIYLFAIGYFLSVLLFYVFARYRLPVVPFLLVFGGTAIVQVIELYRLGRYPMLAFSGVLLAALAILINIPLIDAYNPSAINNLGALLLKMGDLEGARALFQQVLARGPDYADARNNMAVLELRVGDIKSALMQARAAIRLRPRQANGYVNLGEALLRGKDYDGAANAFAQSLELDPLLSEAYSGLGQLRRERGDLEGAAASFRKAMDMNPDSAETHNNLGIVLLGLGRPDEALALLDNATRLRPAFAEAIFNKAICLEKLEREHEAMAAYRQAIAAKPDYAEAYNNLGNLLAEAGERRAAVEAYRSFLNCWRGDANTRTAVEAEISKLTR